MDDIFTDDFIANCLIDNIEKLMCCDNLELIEIGHIIMEISILLDIISDDDLTEDNLLKEHCRCAIFTDNVAITLKNSDRKGLLQLIKDELIIAEKYEILGKMKILLVI